MKKLTFLAFLILGLASSKIQANIFDDAGKWVTKASKSVEDAGASAVHAISKTGKQVYEGGKKAVETTGQVIHGSADVVTSIERLVQTGIAQEKRIEVSVNAIESKVDAINKTSDIIQKINLSLDLINQVISITLDLGVFVTGAGQTIGLIANDLIAPFDSKAARDANDVSNKMTQGTQSIAKLLNTIQTQMIPGLQNSISMVGQTIKNIESDVNKISAVVK